MNEEAAKRADHQPARELQQRYEAMRKARQSWYFDIDQFEQIVDLYFDQGRVRKALSVIHYARTIFPDTFILRLRQAQLLAGMGELNRALELLRALE